MSNSVYSKDGDALQQDGHSPRINYEVASVEDSD